MSMGWYYWVTAEILQNGVSNLFSTIVHHEKKRGFIAQKSAQIQLWEVRILHQCHTFIQDVCAFYVCTQRQMCLYFEAGPRWLEPAFGAHFK